MPRRPRRNHSPVFKAKVALHQGRGAPHHHRWAVRRPPQPDHQVEAAALRRSSRRLRGGRAGQGGWTLHRRAARQDRRADHGERCFVRCARSHERHERKAMIDKGQSLSITRQAEKLGLPGNRQGLPFVDHRFALVPLMRPSAPDKKSFSMVSSPILACSSAMQGPPSLSCSPSPKTAAAPSKSCRFHLVIWLGWTSNRSAMVMRGSSPLIASGATLALNTGEWLRLGLLGIVHTPPGRLPRSSITYRAVQFSPATSFSLAMLVLPEATQRLFDSLYLSSPEGSRVFGEAAVRYIKFVSAILGAVMSGWAAALLYALLGY